MSQRSGMIMMIASALLFSFKPIFAKLAYAHGVAPQVLLGMRMLIAVPLFWGFFLVRSSEKVSVTKKELLLFTTTGFLGFFAAAETSFFALKYIPASINTVIVYTYPSMVTILSLFIFGDRIGTRKVVALAVVLTGTVLVLDLFNADIANINGFGVFLALCSAFFFSLYYTLNKMLNSGISSIKLTTYLITAGGIFIIGFWGGSDIVQPYQVWLYVLGLAVVSTLFPFLLLGEGIKRVGPSNASIYSAIGPVSTITLANILLGEVLGTLQLIGAAFVVTGIVILSMNTKPGELPAKR